MMLCECASERFCGLTLPNETYRTLDTIRGNDESRDLYIVHKDHAADGQELARKGDWVLVRVVGGD